MDAGEKSSNDLRRESYAASKECSNARRRALYAHERELRSVRRHCFQKRLHRAAAVEKCASEGTSCASVATSVAAVGEGGSAASCIAVAPTAVGEHTSDGSCGSTSHDSLGLEYTSNILYKIPTKCYLLPMPTICDFCGAKKFHKESKGFCCCDGSIKLKENDIPEELRLLFTSKSDESDNFRTYIRSYNCNFSFTSFGVKYDKDLCQRNKGIYTFRIQGQIYHYLNQLLPTDSSPSYLQLYFYDTENEIQHRLKISDRLSESNVEKLIHILEINPYAKFFRSLANVTDLENCNIKIACTLGMDQRVYNAPTVSQVAAIWVNDERSDSGVRDICIYTHSGSKHRVNYYFGCYDPLQYPLLFPNGESGWHQGIERVNKHKRNHVVCPMLDANYADSPEEILNNETTVLQKKRKRSQVSCREYYCYKLQVRSVDNSILLHAGRLLQQYVVDMYVKVECSRLDYFRNNQTHIRSELYQGIVDSVENGETSGSNVGRRIILPSSFIGGPRDLNKRYMDAMALVQKFGKPDIFLTITCNSNWLEIKQELKFCDEVQNRPDLVSRIFRSKLEELKKDLFKECVFGPVAAYIYVIEFQKRGLPHAHFLIILKSGSKIFSPEMVDKIVSAEIPDSTRYPYLHSVVVKHMMHGPCGVLNPKNVCMENGGKCRSRYPHSYTPCTSFDEASYPKYRRRNDGKKVKVRKHFLDNRWVVPYNPYLLAKYDCHMNVEICSTIKAVKYLYKYVYKGHDKVSFQLCDENKLDNIDEIERFQSGRWISPPEAMWRIYGFTMYEMIPAVVSLQLHLENKQLVTYRDADNLTKIIRRDFFQKTMLTEFFTLNVTNAEARKLLYNEIPEHFVWDAQGKCWTDRKKKKGCVIGRIVAANPREGERYYLRILLNHVRGPTSFENLKFINGISVETFREAALLLGLLKGNNNCEVCLQEACSYQMPISLRRLFATLLTFCSPDDPKKLWNQFRKFMFEDFVRKNMNVCDAEVSALKSIDSFLEPLGKCLNDYGLAIYDDNIQHDEVLERLVGEELDILIPESDVMCANSLNKEQRAAYDVILGKVFTNIGDMYFIDGPGGTGKTFLYRALLAAVRSKGLIALATASSGVAAGLLPGGRTAHSRFKIPLHIHSDSTCTISKQSALADLFRMTRLIIWDEAPMINRQAVEALDRMLRDITNIDLPFGGKVIVLGGDFRQILPVVQRGSKEDIIASSLVSSNLWPLFTKIKLVQNMRAVLDPCFCEYLLRIGNGTEEEHSCGMVKLWSTMTLDYEEDNISLHKLIDVVFPNINEYPKNLHQMINRIILAPKNEHVDEINSILIDRFPGDAYTYYSFDEMLDTTDQSIQEDFFNSLTPNGIPPHQLLLKIDCPVLLLRNINPTEGLCNGTRLICKHFESNVIVAEIATGEYCGKKVFLPRIPFIPLESDKTVFPFKRTQFPVRPCFAMTINKSQGQTLEYVGIYLLGPVFSHGQLYVALSRARTSKCVKILVKPVLPGEIHTQCTRNVVYEEILSVVM